ncbi:FAD-dependent monooxygenase [Amycolatopsis nigrescens]|uniref:FAD-dependent monooxygenase n=1 Tax=Amycolatopsis nigrescens TaxID=381445 RepID=UPI0003610343|nr:FAD-dependent monooxygenase [Amycolatopsis nigrescens]
MKNQNILISGAGVAGPALAYWLRRYGFKPTVVERAPAPREGGYAVDFRGASLEVLKRMGILDEVRAVGTDMGDMTYVDSAGRKKASTPPVVFSGELEVLRGDLVSILYERTRHDVEYVFGDYVTEISQHDNGVTVGFERAGRREFDLVVGADGLHSATRALAFGAEERCIRDLGLYVSVFTTANHLGLDHAGRFHNSPGKIAGLYSARENTEAKAMVYFASEPLSYDRHDAEQQRKLLNDAFAGAGWEVPRLLAAAADAPDFYFDSISQVHLDHYSSGRVALVGDAGYCASPLSGMGTSLALVGAYVLAGELAAAGGEYRGAFARYEAEMRSFVRACQKQALDSDKWFVPRTNLMIRARNLSYRLIPYLPWKGIFEKVALKVANAITLKDYQG